MEYQITDATEPADVLRAVADEIERVGWCRGHNADETGAVCLDGGLDAVLVGDPLDAADDDPRYGDAFALMLERVQRRGGSTVSFWNDDPRRARAEVLEMLRGG